MTNKEIINKIDNNWRNFYKKMLGMGVTKEVLAEIHKINTETIILMKEWKGE